MNQIQEVILKNKITELTKQKKYTEAEQVCLELTKALPNDLQVRFALGQIQQTLGKLQLAVRSYLEASKTRSDITIQALRLVLDISLKGDFIAEGFIAAQELIKYEPKSPEVNYLRGFFGTRTGLVHLSAIFYEKAINIKPAEHKYRVFYAQALCHLGRVEEGLKQFKLAKDLDKSDDESYYRGIFAQNYCQHLDESTIYQAHLEYGKRLEDRTPVVSPFKARDTKKRLKIAYLSKDFMRHSVAYFFMPIIKSHNAKNFEVFCYSDVVNADDVTKEIKLLSEHWRDCNGLSDQELYQLIRDDEIDILVDLTGMTGNPRMGVYAKKAAPVQINYLGYANTSGLSRMDYRISDNWADPVGLTEQFHSEQLIRLPSGFLCYTPSPSAPELVDLPALKSDKFTFGSFNFFPKITDQVLDTWTEILLRVPHSLLVIKAKIFVEQQNIDALEQKFNDRGIGKHRLIFKANVREVSSHLEHYNQIDIHLDTFPYNGTTTTCEALWQGVPTVTLAGNTHRSRVGNSILNQVGLEDFIATSTEEYINTAVSMAHDLERLTVIRKTMRDELSKSLLMDEKRFISELEVEYSKMVV